MIRQTQSRREDREPYFKPKAPLHSYQLYRDPFTKLLIHFDGTDGATTYTAETDQVVTFVANAQLDTAQYKFETASLLLDGTGDYVTISDSSDWAFGTGDFTIEAWVRFNALPSDTIAAICSQFTGAGNYWYFGLNDTAGAKTWRFESAGTAINIQKTTTVSLNTWYHIALVRGGNNFYIFQDGVQVGTTATSSESVDNPAQVLVIGTVNTNYFDGWIDAYI